MENVKQTINYELFVQDDNYRKTVSHLNEHIRDAQKFYNGYQFPDANPNNDIRIVMNICKEMVDTKASKVNGTPMYFTYIADNYKTDCNALREFDEYNCKKLNLEENNLQSAKNGFCNGTEITEIDWDEDDTTYKGLYKGGLVETHIDPRNFCVANRNVEELQNQKWVMRWNDYDVEAIKDLCEGKDREEKQKLVEQEATNFAPIGDKSYEDVNHKLLTVFTRFFRVDGEVYFMCSTKYVDLFAFPHPLSRKLSSSRIKKIVEEYNRQVEKCENNPLEKVNDYKIDYENIIINIVNKKEFSDKDYKKVKEKFSLYPFADYAPYHENGSFFGSSDIKNVISTQKAVNHAYSMGLKCVENNGMPKYIAKEDALQGQEITNEPGQVLIDYSRGNQRGINILESLPVPNSIIDFADRMISQTKNVYGFNSIMEGQITNQDMSGVMVSQMIKQSNTNIEQQQKLFWKYNKDKAEIRLMYYKHYVDKARFVRELTDEEYEEKESYRKALLGKIQQEGRLDTLPDVTKKELENPSHRHEYITISNDDIYGVNFDICIDVQQGLTDTKLAEQELFNNLFLNGGINNMDPQMLAMWLSCAPISTQTKQKLMRVAEKLKNDEITKLRAQVKDITRTAQDIYKVAKQLEYQTGMQSEYLKQLESEFRTKVNTQNQIIGNLMKPKVVKEQPKKDS